jgi:hypothetical protein
MLRLLDDTYIYFLVPLVVHVKLGVLFFFLLDTSRIEAVRRNNSSGIAGYFLISALLVEENVSARANRARACECPLPTSHSNSDHLSHLRIRTRYAAFPIRSCILSGRAAGGLDIPV